MPDHTHPMTTSLAVAVETAILQAWQDECQKCFACRPMPCMCNDPEFLQWCIDNDPKTRHMPATRTLR